MSNEENLSKATEPSTDDSLNQVNPETVATENPQQSTEVQDKKGITQTLLDLKENNPKVFYGGVAGVVVIMLAVLFSGGNSKNLPQNAPKNLAAGQKYTLKSPNATDDDGMSTSIKLVATPGAIEAFDDEGDNKTEDCRKFPEGTHVSVLDKMDSKGVTFAKVQIEEEQCNGTIGWVLAINL